jgi:hypothetical protein
LEFQRGCVRVLGQIPMGVLGVQTTGKDQAPKRLFAPFIKLRTVTKVSDRSNPRLTRGRLLRRRQRGSQ